MKRLLAFFLVLLIFLVSPLAAMASEGKVSYRGNAQGFVFEPGSEHSPTDLFSDFKGVMPGDTLTQTITVKNDASKEVKVKIYLRSLGAHEDSAAFLSQLKLKVAKSQDNEMAYMFDALAHESAQLTDWVELGTLYSGGEVNLEVSLSVPVELDNEFQDQIGYLDWEFMVEEFAVEDTDPKPPQTGDRSNVGLGLTMIVSALLFLFLLLLRRKKKDGHDASAVRP